MREKQEEEDEEREEKEERGVGELTREEMQSKN